MLAWKGRVVEEGEEEAGRVPLSNGQADEGRDLARPWRREEGRRPTKRRWKGAFYGKGRLQITLQQTQEKRRSNVLEWQASQTQTSPPSLLLIAPLQPFLDCPYPPTSLSLFPSLVFVVGKEGGTTLSSPLR